MEELYDKSWKAVLEPLIVSSRAQELFAYIDEERKNSEVFPKQSLVFNAFKLTAFQDIKVVILGQDPYHNVGQAHGLSFSVPNGIPFPPSLRNIFTELSTDIEGFSIPKSGDLTKWATQGVLLLNAILTVRAHEASSHQKKGWEELTDQIIQQISNKLAGVVFILWGAFAQKKSKLIDSSKHLVIHTAHPSPLSVYRGFWGSKPFSKANDYLLQNGKAAVDWRLD